MTSADEGAAPPKDGGDRADTEPTDPTNAARHASVFDSCIPGGGLSTMASRKRPRGQVTSPTPDSSKS